MSNHWKSDTDVNVKGESYMRQKGNYEDNIMKGKKMEIKCILNLK